MSGPTTPGSPPPEVPEEFAAAYRAAYEQALAAQTGGAQHRVVPEDDDEESPEQAGDDAVDGDDEDTDEIEVQRLPRRRGPLRVGTHRSAETFEPEEDDRPTWFERIRDSTWFVPFLLALLALLLIIGAYAVGRRFADGVAGGADSRSEPRVVLGDGADGRKQSVTHQKPGQGAWRGAVRPIAGVKADVGCVAKAGVDASGKKVTYDAGNLSDGVADTTWRCNGSAVGQRITFRLGRQVPLGEVGLIPGYAKTDEASKADRFAENNRITRVRWTIGKTQVVQRLSGSRTDRDLQLVRVPRTRTDTVTLEILDLAKGPRNTTAISEVQLGRAG